MKGQEEHIDALFRRGFDNSEFGGMEAQWESVYATLEAKRKRKKTGYWFRWLLAVLPILLVVGGVYYHLSSTYATASPTPSVPPPSIVAVPMSEEASGSLRSSLQPAHSSSNRSRLIPLNHSAITAQQSVQQKSVHASGRGAAARKNHSPQSSKEEVQRRTDAAKKTSLPTDGGKSNRTASPLAALSGTAPLLSSLTSSEERELPVSSFHMSVPQGATAFVSHRPKNRWEGARVLSLLNSPQLNSGSDYTGIRGGVDITYFFWRDVFVTTGISVLYKYKGEGFNTVLGQSSFGLRKTTSYYGIDARHLQYLYAPLSIGVKWQRHKLAVGVGMNYFLGAFGRIAEINQEGHLIQEVGSGWIDNRYANHFIPEYNATYLYAMQRMEVGFSVHFNKRSTYPESPIVIGKSTDNIAVGLHIKYPINIPLNI